MERSAASREVKRSPKLTWRLTCLCRRNTVMFDMVWTAVKFANYEVIVDVSGFDPKDQYVCEYVDDANSNIKKITDSKFLDNNK